MGTTTERHRGRHRGRGPPGTSAPTMYNVLVPNVSRPGLHGRARRPRRAAHMEASTGRTRDDIGDDIGDAGRRGRRPLPCTTSSCRTCRVRDCMVGRDVPGAPRTWRRPRDAHGTTSGTTSGTRVAGDVGPCRVRRARAECDVPVPNVSRPGLHGRARVWRARRWGEGYGREKKSTMRAVLSGSTPWGWWPKSARFSTSTFPPAALRRAAKGSQFSAGRTVWSCPP